MDEETGIHCVYIRNLIKRFQILKLFRISPGKYNIILFFSICRDTRVIYFRKHQREIITFWVAGFGSRNYCAVANNIIARTYVVRFWKRTRFLSRERLLRWWISDRVAFQFDLWSDESREEKEKKCPTPICDSLISTFFGVAFSRANHTAHVGEISSAFLLTSNGVNTTLSITVRTRPLQSRLHENTHITPVDSRPTLGESLGSNILSYYIYIYITKRFNPYPRWTPHYCSNRLREKCGNRSSSLWRVTCYKSNFRPLSATCSLFFRLTPDQQRSFRYLWGLTLNELIFQPLNFTKF